MTDIVDTATRSRMMAGIKGKNTKPEMLVRTALHAAGFRYRLHDKNLPGKPDLVFPKYKAVIFVHGCFWHGHDCHYFKLPQSRAEFWRDKIFKNKIRDSIQLANLHTNGWRIAIIWECSTRRKNVQSLSKLIDDLQNWLIIGKDDIQIDETGLKLIPCSTIESVIISKVLQPNI